MKAPTYIETARSAFRQALTDHAFVTSRLTSEDKANPRVLALLDSERDVRQAGLAYASAVTWSVAAAAFVGGSVMGFFSCRILDSIVARLGAP